MSGRHFGEDDAAAFPVFEAVMVAILIFTAILFFTGVGRPSDASEAGGIDLAQNAADILSILETREFGNPAVPMQDAGATEGWVTNLVQNDAATRTEVDALVAEIVPAGALYVLRLSNGQDTLELAPGQGRTPHGARAAEMFVFPTAAYDGVDNAAITTPCTEPPECNMEPPAGTSTLYAVYGLQLVVWFGA